MDNFEFKLPQISKTQVKYFKQFWVCVAVGSSMGPCIGMPVIRLPPQVESHPQPRGLGGSANGFMSIIICYKGICVQQTFSSVLSVHFPVLCVPQLFPITCTVLSSSPQLLIGLLFSLHFLSNYSSNSPVFIKCLLCNSTIIF